MLYIQIYFETFFLYHCMYLCIYVCVCVGGWVWRGVCEDLQSEKANLRNTQNDKMQLQLLKR